MADQETQLLTPKTRNDYFEQAKKIPEEFPVDFHPLLLVLFVRRVCISSNRGLVGAQFGLPSKDSFLFGDGIIDSVDECDDQGDVDGSRDLCAVFEVEGGQFRDQLSHSPLRR